MRNFSYRHIIGKKEKDMVIKSLRTLIKKNKFGIHNFSFIGIVGSHAKEYSHDIDLLMFPAKDAKVGEVLIEIGNIYSELQKEIKKYHHAYYISACPRKVMQEMTYYISSIEEGHAGLIPIHSLFFPDYKSFKKFNPKSFEAMIKKDLLTLHGSFKDIKKIKPLPQKKLDPYFFVSDYEMMSRLSTYPRQLVRSSVDSLLSYMQSKYGIEREKKIHNLSDARKAVINLLHKLDLKTYG